MMIRLIFGLFGLLFLGSSLAAQDFLPPGQAFRFSAQAADKNTLEVRFAIAKGYYLYKERFRFRAEPETVQLGAPLFPVGQEKMDEQFGKVTVFHDEVLIRVPVQTPGDVHQFKLIVVSQGCAEAGICYPPQTQSMEMDLGSVGKGAPLASATIEAVGDDSQVARLLKEGGLGLILLSFFGFGVALAFTPCVFPMIPILSGIIAGHGHTISKQRALVLSLAYVLPMAITYALVGVAAGLSGTLLSNALQNIWVLSAFSLIFVLLALSMFGFYELQLPSALQSRLSETSSHQTGGSLSGVAIMGALSALIVGPCVAAPLAGAVLYIAKSKDAWLGGSALFVLGLGMGLPLILVGVFTRGLLPKPGPWMEGVKRFFGVMLLAVAIWLVSPVIPPALVMLAWAMLLILSAMYVHALEPLPAQAHGWQRFWKGVGILALLTGASLLVGVLAGSRDVLQPLAILRASATANPPVTAFQRVSNLAELEAALSKAGKPVMLDFYAEWCVSCKEMERFTFSDPKVQSHFRNFLVLQADVTANAPTDQALLKRFDLLGPPGIIFFNAKGQELKEIRVVGFLDAARFSQILEKAEAI